MAKPNDDMLHAVQRHLDSVVNPTRKRREGNLVNLCERLCALFGRQNSKDREIAELVKTLKNLISIADRQIDGMIEVEGLKKRLGVGRPYAGVA